MAFIEKERRLLHVSLVPGGSFNVNTQLPEYNAETKAIHDAFMASPDTAGARDVFNTFGERDLVSSEDLQQYIDEKTGSGVALTAYEQAMKGYLDTLSGDPHAKTTEELAKSEKEIKDLVAYINSRNATLKKQKAELKNFKVQGDESPYYTGKVIEGAKGVLGVTAERFKRANLTEKGVLLGGAISAFLMLRFVYMKIPGTGFLKKLLGFSLGAALTASAFETIAHAGKKGFKSNDAWNAGKHANEIEEMRQMLKKQDVPDSFMQEIGTDKNKVVAPIANISTMTVEEFLNMYENARGSKTIEDTDPMYPRKPIRKDGLMPIERYAIAEDIAITVGLADASGDVKEVPPEMEGKSMMYLMLNWNKPKTSPAGGVPGVPAVPGSGS